MVSLLAIVLLALPATSTQPATADLLKVRENYVHSIAPDDPVVRAELIRSAGKQAETLREDGTWPDIDFTDQSRSQWKARAHLERAAIMARAYHLSKDPALLAKLHSSLDFWLAKDFRNPNWWHNEIGTPLLIGTIDLLLGDQLFAKEKEKSLEILRRSNWKKWTGQNLVWGVNTQILRGLIDNDPETVAAAYERLYQEIRNDSPEGIQPDWSFHQHGAQLYNGGYGLNFAQDQPRLASYAWGTRWQIDPDRLKLLCDFLLDGEQWMLHNQRLDYSTVGREITRKGKTAIPKSWNDGGVAPVGVTYGLPRAIQILADLPVPRQSEFQTFAARLAGDPNAPPLIGNRHFWCSDYMVHHRLNWMTSVKMFSTRTINAELVNSEGKQSHHLSDGANFLYLTGDEYLDIFPVWDWTKIPGTTAEQNTLELDEPKSIGIKSKSAFVGGVSDGTFGLAAMHLARGKLSARKCWVFLDDSYICLGTDIHCDDDNPIATTVNQCLLDGKVSKGEGWIHHAGVGYVFPNPPAIEWTSGTQEGTWASIGAGSNDPVRKDVFKLWIDHGRRPKDAGYVYCVFPDFTANQTLARSKSLGIEVLSNTPDVQAVRDAKLDLTAIAFWKPGKIGAIEVDQPCLLLVRKEKGKTTLSISNPENQPLTVNVRIDGQLTTMKLPDGPKAGSSVTQLHPPG